MNESQLVNMGPRERTTRHRLAILFFAVAAVLAIVFLAGDAGKWTRAILFLPLLLGTGLLFESKSGTCPLKAELGQADLGNRLFTILGSKIADPVLARRTKRASRVAQLKAFLLALMITLIVVVLP